MTTTMERPRTGTTSQPDERRRDRAVAAALSGLAIAAAVWAIASAVGNGSSAMLQAALAAVWAVTGAELARRGEPHAAIVAGGALVAGIGAAWSSVAPFAAALLPAVGMHLLLSMPDGALHTTARRVLSGIAYV